MSEHAFTHIYIRNSPSPRGPSDPIPPSLQFNVTKYDAKVIQYSCVSPHKKMATEFFSLIDFAESRNTSIYQRRHWRRSHFSNYGLSPHRSAKLMKCDQYSKSVFRVFTFWSLHGSAEEEKQQLGEVEHHCGAQGWKLFLVWEKIKHQRHIHMYTQEDCPRSILRTQLSLTFILSYLYFMTNIKVTDMKKCSSSSTCAEVSE